MSVTDQCYADTKVQYLHVKCVSALTCQNCNLRIRDRLAHLRMCDRLVENDASHQSCVFELSADLSLKLDEVKVDIFAFEICNGQHSIHSDLCHLTLVTIDNLTAESGDSSIQQRLSVLRSPVDL